MQTTGTKRQFAILRVCDLHDVGLLKNVSSVIKDQIQRNFWKWEFEDFLVNLLSTVPTNTFTLTHTIRAWTGPHILPHAHQHHQRCREFSQHARCSHQVHGGAAWRMWLNKQLRWRLSKALDLRLCGLREREREEKERERAAVTINMHQSDGSMRYLTMQANPNSAVPLRKGGGKGKGVHSQSAWVLPLPPSPCRVIQVLVWKRQAFSY